MHVEDDLFNEKSGAKTRAPPLLLEDNGPIIEKKLKRKRWLAKVRHRKVGCLLKLHFPP
jgi:hypothetical protein